ncbi:hypothetical protein [uncultured Brevundimonas sp.]|uniref:hypothetical protein n=1 Tax=uncultured Brevundimonas sp. TaxID=213418 RepID=UPI0025E7BBA3|nr:hypothetical protein [uncultured Brevundimonas sp.]
MKRGDLKTYVFILRTSDGGDEREAVAATDDAQARALAEIIALVAGVGDRLEVYDSAGRRLTLEV